MKNKLKISSITDILCQPYPLVSFLYEEGTSRFTAILSEEAVTAVGTLPEGSILVTPALPSTLRISILNDGTRLFELDPQTAVRISSSEYHSAIQEFIREKFQGGM